MESKELIYHSFPSTETTICNGPQTGVHCDSPSPMISHYCQWFYDSFHAQERKRNFVTFHDSKPLEPLVNEKWEDFNVKINVTLPQVLGWVGSKI